LECPRTPRLASWRRRRMVRYAMSTDTSIARRFLWPDGGREANVVALVVTTFGVGVAEPPRLVTALVYVPVFWLVRTGVVVLERAQKRQRTSG